MSEQRLWSSKKINLKLNCRYDLRFNDIQKSSDECWDLAFSPYVCRNSAIRTLWLAFGKLPRHLVLTVVTDVYELINNVILGYNILSAYCEHLLKSLH